MGNDYYVGINKEKTEVKVSEKEGDSTVQIILNGDTLKNVKRFKYSGSRVTKNGRSVRKIQFCKARSKKRLFTSNDISWITRKRLLKAFVWGLAFYGCKTWTIGKEEERRLISFENSAIKE